MFTPFIREGIEKQKAWEKKFYEEAEALAEPVGCAAAPACYSRAIAVSSLPGMPIPTPKTDTAAPKVSFVSLGCPKALVDQRAHHHAPARRGL